MLVFDLAQSLRDLHFIVFLAAWTPSNWLSRVFCLGHSHSSRYPRRYIQACLPSTGCVINIWHLERSTSCTVTRVVASSESESPRFRIGYQVLPPRNCRLLFDDGVTTTVLFINACPYLEFNSSQPIRSGKRVVLLV